MTGRPLEVRIGGAVTIRQYLLAGTRRQVETGVPANMGRGSQ